MPGIRTPNRQTYLSRIEISSCRRYHLFPSALFNAESHDAVNSSDQEMPCFGLYCKKRQAWVERKNCPSRKLRTRPKNRIAQDRDEGQEHGASVRGLPDSHSSHRMNSQEDIGAGDSLYTY